MSHRPLLAFAAASAGLLASAALAWQYHSEAAGLCSIGGGCEAVRNSSFSSIAGVPLPLVGVAFFAVVLALLAIGERAWKPLRFAVLSGAVVAAGLLAIQGFVIGTFCRYCVVVDVSAIALVALVWPARDWPEISPRRRATAIGSIAFITAGAMAFLIVRADATPTVAIAPSGDADSDVVTITEFVDFQCPHCRELHRVIADLKKEFGDTVRVVRKHVPLPRHADAEGAARAACCAEKAGAAEEMADRLMTARDLRPDACADIATSLGIDRAEFESCLASPETDQRLASDLAEAKAVGVRALPTTFIGDQRFEGAQSADTLRAAIVAAREAL